MNTYQTEGTIAIIGFFVFVIAVLVVIFLIVRKVLNDRHQERLAMIEKGFIMSGQRKTSAGEQEERQEEMPFQIPDNEYRKTPAYETPKPKAEDSTIKWMFILGGIAAGLLVSSVVTDILYKYTLLDTDGIGFSIVVVFACLALYIYYRRKSKKEVRQYHQMMNEQSSSEAKKEEYTEE